MDSHASFLGGEVKSDYLYQNKQGRPIPTGRERENEPQTKLLTEHSIEVPNMLSGGVLHMEIIFVITFLTIER